MTRPDPSSPRAGAPAPSGGGEKARGNALALLLSTLLAGSLACFGDYGGGDPGGAGGTGTTTVGGPPGGSGGGQDSVAAFGVTAFPVLRDNCIACHSGAGPGSPSIAHSDVTTAHDAVVDNQKVNLGNPGASRLVQRLVADFHFCWTDCVSDGATMTAAIDQWATLIDFGGGGTNVGGGIASSTLTLADGVEDQGQRRNGTGAIALWEFKEGSGATAFDTSGVAPAMDLDLISVGWQSGYGIELLQDQSDPPDSSKAMATREASRKLYDAIASPEGGSNQYSIEAWVTPANVTQEGPSRIVSYSNGKNARNFTLGQVQYTYDYRNRNLSAEIADNGTPSLQTYDADRDLQDTLQHVVATYDPYRGRRIYVNGRFTDDVDPHTGQMLWNWDENHRFVLGNETNNDRPFRGRIHLVAIYDHAMTQAQIQQNFEAGVGRRLLMTFDLSQWAGAGSQLEFTVTEFDAFSYLFCQPTFRGGNPSGLRVKNMRILVNGQVPVSGQAFVNVDATVTGSGQELSRQCSIVPKDLGPGSDSFAIEFEILGGFQNLVVEGPPPPPPGDVFGDPMPDTGIRDFAKINDSMAALTGVDPTVGSVRATFEELQQQLPGGFDLRSFVSSHQVGIAKLALEYCDALVESPGLRDAFFGATPPFEFDAPVATAFSDQTREDRVIDALTDRMLGVNLASQPGAAEVHAELDLLLDDLRLVCSTDPCGAERTRTVVKAACAAVLSSAAVSMH